MTMSAAAFLMGLLFVTGGRQLVTSQETAMPPLYDYGPTAGDSDGGASNDEFNLAVTGKMFDRSFERGRVSGGNIMELSGFVHFWSGPGIDFAATNNTHRYHRSTTDNGVFSQLEGDIVAAFGNEYPHNVFEATMVTVVTFANFTYTGGDETTPTNCIQVVFIVGRTTAIFSQQTPEMYVMFNIGDIGWWERDGTYPTIGFSYQMISSKFAYYVPGSGTSDIENILPLGNTNVAGRWLFLVTSCNGGYCMDAPNTLLMMGTPIDLSDTSSSYTVVCEDGYTGDLCIYNATTFDYCDPDPCALGSCQNVVMMFECQCDAGYTGELCTEDIDDCANEPCFHGSCTDGVDSFNCTCYAGYTGDQCELNIDDCQAMPCINGCCTDLVLNYTCECYPGWTGYDCDVDIDDCDPDPCVNGTCLDLVHGYNCTCDPGFSGPLCDENIDDCFLDPCVYGVCVDGIASYRCDCVSGYSGRLCEVDMNDCSGGPCTNGFCVDLVSNYSCECFPGWTGVDCADDVDECHSDPCQFGVCNDEVNGFNCTCWSGYTGVLCEINIDDCVLGPCVNGSCIDGEDSFNCSCAEGFTGRLCEVNIDDCWPEPCANGCCLDLVANYSCECFPGWTGYDCDVDVNECQELPCVHGSCQDLLNGYNCSCQEGYSGFHCDLDIDDCSGQPCINGNCTDGVNSYSCSCYDGYSGTWCEQNIDDCSHDPCENGFCHDDIGFYWCECHFGYMGHNCDTQILNCTSDPCVNGACLDITTTFSCSCEPGFTGDLCEVDIDECRSDPCIQGTCDSSGPPDSYTCTCLPGYTGSRCELNIDECDVDPCVSGTCIDGVNGFSCLLCDDCADNLCKAPVDYCQNNSLCQLGECVSVGLPLEYYCDCIDGVSGRHCHVDGRPPVATFGAWSDYGLCSKTCGIGLQIRTRQCLREPCTETNIETRLCNTQNCTEDPNEIDTILISSSKETKEVVSEEKALKQEVADDMNAYCSSHTHECCSIIPTSVNSNSAINDFTYENVRIASGYPVTNSASNIQIRFFVTIPDTLEASCSGDAAAMRSLLQSTDLDVVPKEVVLRAIGNTIGDTDEAVCCYVVESSVLVQDDPMTLLAAVVGLSVALVIVIALLVVAVAVIFSRRSRKKTRKDDHGRPTSRDKEQIARRYYPRYLNESTISRYK